MKKKITEKSFDGHFFVDNAVYRDGVPVNTENHSEHCQYGAFFFGIADREHFSELWDELMKTTEDTFIILIQVQKFKDAIIFMYR
mgnify:CR=1 FL=1